MLKSKHHISSTHKSRTSNLEHLELRTSKFEPRTFFLIPIILVIILLFRFSVSAQNLVPNPSFEVGSVQCDFIFDYPVFKNSVSGWWIPTTGTTDVFSTTLTNSNCWAYMPANEGPLRYPDVPRIGDQLPRTGTRFIGLFTYSKGIPLNSNNPADTTYREYARVKLEVPLIVGESYCAEMYVSLAERPRFAANNLGMYFHEKDVWQPTWIEANPQVIEKEIILNTASWVKVDGKFQADVPAEYLTIGNFLGYHDTKVTDKKGADPTVERNNYAYYFVDDVSVTKFEPKTFIFTGATTICDGELAYVSISGGLEKIVWSALSDTTKLLGGGINFEAKPFETTSYLIKGSNCGVIVKDTLTVTVKRGKPIELGGDQVICEGTSLKLDAGEGHSSYKWQDGSADRFYHVTKAGNYSVSVENLNGCLYSDNIRITMDDIPKLSLGNDSLVCEGFYPLRPGYRPDVTYKWSTGSDSHEITPTASGTYSVTLRHHCGEVSDTIKIYSPEEVFIPNVVTANNDHKNDFFVISGKSFGLDVSVYNRWGTEIFTSRNYDDNWPTERDNIPSGTYYYKVTYPGCRTFNGWLQLIRN